MPCRAQAQLAAVHGHAWPRPGQAWSTHGRTSRADTCWLAVFRSSGFTREIQPAVTHARARALAPVRRVASSGLPRPELRIGFNLYAHGHGDARPRLTSCAHARAANVPILNIYARKDRGRNQQKVRVTRFLQKEVDRTSRNHELLVSAASVGAVQPARSCGIHAGVNTKMPSSGSIPSRASDCAAGVCREREISSGDGS